MRTAITLLGAVLCSMGATSAYSQGGSFRAGSAVVDITPPTSAIGLTDLIRDPLSVKAIVIRNDVTCAVLVGIDIVGLRQEFAQNAIAAASLAVGCPRENFLISATHTHSGGVGSPRGPQTGSPDIQAAILKAVGDVNNRLQPARIGFATTRVDLNINRDLFVGNRWRQGPNPDGPSDKTLAVLAVIGEDDLLVGVYINYAMHPINFYMSGVVSADFAGEASRYVQGRYSQSTVAIFAQGASGRDREDSANPVREGALPPYADGAPVDISVGLLRIGNIYISSVNGEVYSDISQKLKDKSPVPKLMMTTLANGSANSGYIYSDAAKDNLTFQVIGSRLKPGCAESGIVEKIVDMIAVIDTQPVQ